MRVYYNENDPQAVAWLRRLIQCGHLPAGVVDDRSILDVLPSDLDGFDVCHFFAGIGGWAEACRLARVGRPLWTASCPCQPFSAAGARRGTADERHLWPALRWLITQCRPPVVVGEQVAGTAGRAWLDDIFTDLENLAYAPRGADLCAASVGAPHIRQRLYWLADDNERGREIVRETRLHADRQRGDDTAGRGEAGRLADDGALGRERRADSERRAGEDAAERREGLSDVERGGDTRGMGDSGGDGVGQHVGELPRDEAQHALRTTHRDHPPVVAGAVSYPWWLEYAADRRRACGGGSDGAERPEPADAGSPWDDCDWLPCRDHVWRPVEPGTFPLAHGVPARVGRLRGYGNAIVPHVAAAFLEAAL